MPRSTLASAVLAGMTLAASFVALADTSQLEGPAGKKPAIAVYADADGQHRSGQIPVAELRFPLKVFEETPTGMVRIQHGGQDHWVAAEEFKVRRTIQADCLVAMPRIATGADRGANEGCTVRKKP